MLRTKRKLQLAAAFTVLLLSAAGLGCRGFFVASTVTGFTLLPANPTVPLNGTAQMHAWATYNDNSPTNDIASQVSWSSSDMTVITINSTGLLSGKALSMSAVTISASYQALPAQTTTATVCVENGTNFMISPANSSVTEGNPLSFTASTLVGGSTVDITSGVLWSTNNAGVAITNGTDPSEASTNGTYSPVPPTPVLITASYSCNGVTNTFTTNLQVN